MGNVRKELTNFIVHLNKSGVIKKGTVLTDEVKYYLENVRREINSHENAALPLHDVSNNEVTVCDCFLPERSGRYTDLKNICCKCGKKIAN